jgi:hypothetical protein
MCIGATLGTKCVLFVSNRTYFACQTGPSLSYWFQWRKLAHMRTFTAPTAWPFDSVFTQGEKGTQVAIAFSVFSVALHLAEASRSRVTGNGRSRSLA